MPLCPNTRHGFAAESHNSGCALSRFAGFQEPYSLYVPLVMFPESTSPVLQTYPFLSKSYIGAKQDQHRVLRTRERGFIVYSGEIREFQD